MLSMHRGRSRRALSLLLAGTLLAGTLLAGCAAGVRTPDAADPHSPLPSDPPATKVAPAAQLDPGLMEATDRFGFNLFHTLRAAEPDENLFISPASVALILALTYNGARGETEEAMAHALSLQGMPKAELNKEYSALQSVLANPDPKVQVSIANSIWHQKGYSVDPAFLKVSTEEYRAAVEAVDFAGPDAAVSINQWVSDATRGKIPTLVEQTRADDRMYLINALYFKGDWQEPFDPDRTRPTPFHHRDGSIKDHPMMSRSGYFRYLKGDQFQAVALPYGEGRLSMYIFLPAKGVEPDDFYATMTDEAWTDWLTRFQRKEGTLTMPKVKLSYEAELSDTMKALGMGVAFTDQADFSGLFAQSDEQLSIAFILHKTYLDVNEKGTEAAAVTGVGVGVTSAPAPDSRFDMLVDRPYFLAIRDDQTGATLFMGAIVDPQS